MDQADPAGGVRLVVHWRHHRGGGAWNASIVSEIVAYGHTTLTANGLGTYIANATAVGDTGKTIIGVAVMSVFVVGVNQLFWRPLQAYAERRFSVA